MYRSTQNRCSLATFLIETESRITEANSKKHGGDSKRWALTPFPFLAPWPYRPSAIETPPRPVPAGTLISWPENASCSRIPPRASRASLPPRRWATTCCPTVGSHSARALRLYLAACNPSSSFCSWVLTISAPICLNRFTFAESRKPNLWSCVCVFNPFLFCLYFSDKYELQVEVPVYNLVVITTAIPLLLLP